VVSPVNLLSGVCVCVCVCVFAQQQQKMNVLERVCGECVCVCEWSVKKGFSQLIIVV